MKRPRTLLAGAFTTAFSIALTVPALVGCGGKPGGDAPCGTTGPCGGDVVGTWVSQQVCATPSTIGACTITPGDYSGYHLNLTYVFRRDLSFSASGSVTGGYSSTSSPGCFADGGTTCAQTDDSLKKIIESPDGSITGGGCEETGAGCTCSLTVRSTTFAPLSGTYRIEGATLHLETTTDAGTSGSDITAYCVRDGSLHLLAVPPADAGRTGGTADFVFTRQ